MLHCELRLVAPSGWNIDHSCPSSALFCAAASIFLQLNLYPAVHISFSRSLFHLFFGRPLSNYLWPCAFCEVLVSGLYSAFEMTMTYNVSEWGVKLYSLTHLVWREHCKVEEVVGRLESLQVLLVALPLWPCDIRWSACLAMLSSYLFRVCLNHVNFSRHTWFSTGSCSDFFLTTWQLEDIFAYQFRQRHQTCTCSRIH